MATTAFVDTVSLTAASWFNNVDTVTYSYLTSPAGTNTITATGPASMTGYAAGQKFSFLPANDNTGATTINITPSGGAALGAKNIFQAGSACIGGEIQANIPCTIQYDGTQFNVVGPYNGGEILAAIRYGGVTLSNAVTGTGNMVLSASPTLTGTLTAAIANFSGAVGLNAGAVIAASQALTGTAANSTISGFLSVSATNFISGTTTTTAFAGATTLLTIGGTGASSVFAIPGTKTATNSTTASVTMAGGLAVADNVFVGNAVNATTGTFTNVGGTLTTASQTAITGVGTITTGVWNAGAVTSSSTIKATTGAAVGGATPGTGGVAFPATSVAVADANTLDDYEEGTWTPIVGGTATYTAQTGYYTKIGNVVHVWGSITINSIGSGSADTLSGLPFTAASTGRPQVGAVGYWASLAVNALALGMYVNDNSASCSFPASTAAGTTVGSAALALLGSGTRVDFSANYFI